MPGTPRVLDMAVVDRKPRVMKNGREMSVSSKAIRARARRAGKIYKEDLEALYKPIEQWDEEELARGRCRARDGSFKGQAPAFITREIHEAAMDRFKDMIKQKMREETTTALQTLAQMMIEDERDDKGKPIVPASVRLNAAQFLIEHAVGKPVQHVKNDISVKLQAVLAAATVNPTQAEQAFALGQSSDFVEADSWEDDDDLEPTDG